MNFRIPRRIQQIFTEKNPGQTIALVGFLAFLAILIGLLVVSTNPLLLGLAALACYLFFIRWITFRQPVKRWLIPALFCLVWLIPLIRLYLNTGGGPISWDELLYMDLGRTSTAEPRVLNQYFHIFLLRIFYLIFGTSDFLAAQYYWILVQSIVLILVYEAAVILTRRYSTLTRIVCGLTAVILLAIQPQVMEFIGVAYVDFTLELLFTGAAFLLVATQARPGWTRFALIAIGLLFGLGLKTKEVGLAIIVPAIGLALINRPQRAEWRYWLRSAALFALGVVAGLLVMVVLNTIILQRPLWGFTPSDLTEWFYLRTGYDPGLITLKNENYFTELLCSASILCLAGILYLAYRPEPKMPWSVYKTLSIQIAAFIFLYTFIPFQPYGRYLIPVYPVLAFMAAPALARFIGDSPRRLLQLALVSIPVFAITWFIRQKALTALDPVIYIPAYLYAVFVIPIIFCAVWVAILLLPKRMPTLRFIGIAALLWVAVFYPLINLSSRMIHKSIASQSYERFEILRQWNPDVASHMDKMVFISAKLENPNGNALAISADYARIMLNLNANVSLPAGSVTADIDEFLQADKSKYCYGIMMMKEYDLLEKDQRRILKDSFLFSYNKSKRTLFLTNPACQ